MYIYVGPYVFATKLNSYQESEVNIKTLNQTLAVYFIR
jgi:hypothetical protein